MSAFLENCTECRAPIEEHTYRREIISNWFVGVQTTVERTVWFCSRDWNHFRESRWNTDPRHVIRWDREEAYITCSPEREVPNPIIRPERLFGTTERVEVPTPTPRPERLFGTTERVEVRQPSTQKQDVLTQQAVSYFFNLA